MADLNTTESRAVRSTAQGASTTQAERPRSFGMGIAEHEDLVWLTNRDTGGIVFTGTAHQLIERADLVAGLSQRQCDELAASPAQRDCKAMGRSAAPALLN